jgi:hypothetical protein
MEGKKRKWVLIDGRESSDDGSLGAVITCSIGLVALLHFEFFVSWELDDA